MESSRVHCSRSEERGVTQADRCFQRPYSVPKWILSIGQFLIGHHSRFIAVCLIWLGRPKFSLFQQRRATHCSYFLRKLLIIGLKLQRFGSGQDPPVVCYVDCEQFGFSPKTNIIFKLSFKRRLISTAKNLPCVSGDDRPE